MTAPALLYIPTENIEAVEVRSSFFLTLSIVAGYLFVQILIARGSQRQKSRRIERGIAEYLRQKAVVD